MWVLIAAPAARPQSPPGMPPGANGMSSPEATAITEKPPGPGAGGGISPSDHAAHHPKGPAGKGGPPSGGAGSGPSGMAAMMGGMEKMMEGMHGTPPKELYPSLMKLPALSEEERTAIAGRASERKKAAEREIKDAAARLEGGTSLPERSKAASDMREALAQYESALNTERALSSEAPADTVAMQWFKRELNLPTGPAPSHQRLPMGLPMGAFHALALVIMGLFAGSMFWMYFQRMHRASELLSRLGNAPTSFLAPQPIASGPTTTGTWSGPLRVARIFDETPGVKTFRLSLPEGGEALPFSFEPGQFLTVTVNVNGSEVKRSYSIASSPCCMGWCELTVKHAPGGIVSGYLHEQVKEGDLLNVAGAYGKFTFRGNEATDVVFIAGGVGITPLMSSIRFLTDQSWTGDIFLIYACGGERDLIFKEELDYLRRRHPKLHITFTLSKEEAADWTGERGFVTRELLERVVPDLGRRRVHLCGPPPMMEAVKGALSEAGVPASQVYTELFLKPEVRKPAPLDAEAAPVTAAAVCTFARSRKNSPLLKDTTVLEAAEAVGVDIPFSCREGYCGVCKTRLLAGHVTMEVTDGLTPAELQSNIILACQAKATADIAVDA